jgi:hypothetical protein
MQSANTAAHFLNLCDRLVIVSELVSDENHNLMGEVFDSLMDRGYPCLAQFCSDAWDIKDAVHLSVDVGEEDCTFAVTHADDTATLHTYANLDLAV